MKGNPILRLCLVLLLLAAVLVPVCRLTLTMGSDRRSDIPSATQGRAVTTKPSGGRLLLQTAPSPLRCAITLRGKTLLTESNLLSTGEYAAEAEVTPGDDLLVTAEWADETPHAVRAEFSSRGMTVPVVRSYWAKGSLEDVLTIPVTQAAQTTPER